MMAKLVAFLAHMFGTKAGQWVMGVLLSLGIGMAAEKVGAGLMDSSAVMAALQSAGPLFNWVHYLRLDEDATIILSAWAGRSLSETAKVHLVHANVVEN